MKKITVLASAIAACLGSFAVQAQPQEMGRVLSSTPVVQQVGVPRQVCTNQPVAVQSGNSGGGAAIGAVAGGLLGNTVGHGSGRGAATILGAVGGAMVGNNIEGRGNAQVQNVQQCTTQTFYESRTVGFNVVYEYNGRQYTVQMPRDPGPYIRLQITPVGAVPVPDGAQYAEGGQPAATILQPGMQAATVVVPSTVVYPAYYPNPYYASPYYYPPVGVSLGFGFGYGGYPHRHWR